MHSLAYAIFMQYLNPTDENAFYFIAKEQRYYKSKPELFVTHAIQNSFRIFSHAQIEDMIKACQAGFDINEAQLINEAANPVPFSGLKLYRIEPNQAGIMPLIMFERQKEAFQHDVKHLIDHDAYFRETIKQTVSKLYAEKGDPAIQEMFANLNAAEQERIRVMAEERASGQEIEINYLRDDNECAFLNRLALLVIATDLHTDGLDEKTGLLSTPRFSAMMYDYACRNSKKGFRLWDTGFLNDEVALTVGRPVDDLIRYAVRNQKAFRQKLPSYKPKFV